MEEENVEEDDYTPLDPAYLPPGLSEEEGSNANPTEAEDDPDEDAAAVEAGEAGDESKDAEDSKDEVNKLLQLKLKLLNF